MIPFLEPFVQEGTDPYLLMFLNTIISLHLFALAAYFVLLARSIINGTDASYPYKQTE